MNDGLSLLIEQAYHKHTNAAGARRRNRFWVVLDADVDGGPVLVGVDADALNDLVGQETNYLVQDGSERVRFGLGLNNWWRWRGWLFLGFSARLVNQVFITVDDRVLDFASPLAAQHGLRGFERLLFAQQRVVLEQPHHLVEDGVLFVFRPKYFRAHTISFLSSSPEPRGSGVGWLVKTLWIRRRQFLRLRT